MKKTIFCKKLFSILLIILILLGTLPITTLTVNASTSGITREQAIEWAKTQTSNPKDYDGAYGVQCVDLAVAYYKYLGEKSPGGNGRDYATNKLPTGWTRIKNSSGFVPKPGDIAVWTKTGSVYGHVAIVLYADLSTLTVAEFLGSNHTARTHTYSYSYGTFYGVIRPDFPDSSSYKYSFDFNANGGILGSTGAFSVAYGDNFKVSNTTCTREGYTWAGWNVKCNKDNTWYVAGQGWCSESEIANNSYTKKKYNNGTEFKLDDSWISGRNNNLSFTFYAVWIKSRETYLKTFMSPLGSGFDHITALNNYASSGYTQEQIYLWYVLYDGNTGDLLNSYSDKNYSVEMTIYDPNGDIVHNYTYDGSNDVNWIGFKPEMSGTYTATTIVNGDLTGSNSTTYQVSYDAELLASLETVSLNLNGTNSSTITITPSGSYPGQKNATINYNGSCVSVSSKWSNGQILVTVNGLKVGNTSIRVDLYEEYTGNKNIVAQLTIPIKITSNTYTITYNANGGSGVPSSQTKYYGNDIILSSNVPTGKSYTVTFNGNGGTVSQQSKTFTQEFIGWNTKADGTGKSYSPGDVYSGNAGLNLYAQYSYPNLKIENPKKDGKYFYGWYDSLEVDEHGKPLGNKYNIAATNFDVATPITKNVTLYAFWSNSATRLIGDYNYDGSIDAFDALAAAKVEGGNIEFSEEDLFFLDIDANGFVDHTDAELIIKYVNGKISKNEFLEFNPQDIVIYTYPKLNYEYGEEFDISGLSIKGFYPKTYYNSNCSDPLNCPLPNAHCHELNAINGENLILSGYNPYKTGYQVVTINFYQFETKLEVYVNNPKYTITYNANGGTVSSVGKTVTYGNTIGSLPTPTRNGYTFLGWTYEETGTTYVKSTDIYSYMSNKTLCAQWSQKTYTLTYNSNGGLGAPTSQIKIHGQPLIISNIVPTRTGYKFKGWAITSEATDASYQPGTSFYNEGHTTLYAVWELNQYTVSYNANGGSGAPLNQTKVHNKPLTLSNTIPTRTGYIFKGWATSSTATTANYQAGDTYSSNDSLALYAVWEKEVVLSSISVKSNPTKSVYYIGDDFSSTGLVVKLNYSDGSSDTITNGFTTTGFSSTTTGTKTVTVSYKGFTDTFTVEVKTPIITLSSSSNTMSVGGINTITATTIPNGQAVTWTSSNTSIATVSGGTITAQASGSVIITANFTYNGITYSETCVVSVTDSVIASGTCGTSANWELLSDGTLKITGSGATKNYGTQQSVPWYSYASQVKKVIIDESITKIGHYSFYCLTNLESVTTDNAELGFGVYVFSNKTTFYAKGAGALEEFVKTDGHTLIKPENPETVLNPELIEATMNSITLKALSGYEYSMDGIVWQDSNVFTNLFADTEYVFYQRIKDGAYKVSATSEEARFSTLDQIAKPTIEKIENNTVTLAAKDGYEYSVDGNTWQSSNVFTDLDFDKIITFYQRIAGDTENISEATECLIPSAPVIQLVGATKVVIKAIDGYEYSLDGEYWQSSNVFTMLVPEFDYVVYQRYAGSDVYTVTSAETEFITNGQDINTNPSSGDLVLIRQALLQSSENNNLCFDYNGDGEINILDLVCLKKFLAGIDVPLGTSEQTQTQTLDLLSQPAYLEQKNTVA